MSQSTKSTTAASASGMTVHEATDSSILTSNGTTLELSDIIQEVRLGKMKLMSGLKIRSGIDKQRVDGPVHVGVGGIEGDEHDYTFHGGPDKAIHGCEYSSCFFFPSSFS